MDRREEATDGIRFGATGLVRTTCVAGMDQDDLEGMVFATRDA